jgi:hypothetical protein
MDTFFETDIAKKLLSVLFGFGFATVIREICKSDYCTVNKASDIDSKTIFKNNDVCMTFDTAISSCTDTKPITIENTFTPKSNFKITQSDKIMILGVIGILFVSSKVLGLYFWSSTTVFLVSVYINMYLGPVAKTINHHPTPFNLDKTYKTKDVCFKYTSTPTECTPKAQPIPLQL